MFIHQSIIRLPTDFYDLSSYTEILLANVSENAKKSEQKNAKNQSV